MEAFEEVWDLQIVRYMMVGTLALLAYEYTVTLEQEVTFMWNRRLSFAKSLFFMNRYMPLPAAALLVYLIISTTRTDPAYCHRLLLACAAFLAMDIMLSMGILFLRAYAVWPSSKFIPRFLVAFAVAVIIIAVFFNIRYMENAMVIAQASPSHGCVIVLPSDGAQISLVIFLISDTVALSFLVAKVLLSYRGSLSTPRLLGVIVTDGIGYSICITAITIANVIIFHAANPIFRGCLILTQISLQNILCNRLLLHVHAVNAARAEFSNVLHLIDLPGHSSAATTTV